MKSLKHAAGLVFVVVGLLVGGTMHVAGQTADVRVGTWKLNLAKSTFPAQATPPQSVTRTYEAFEGDGVRYRSEAVAADGSRSVETYNGHMDGKDYAWTGSTTWDSIAMRRHDSRSFEFTTKKAGKVVLQGRNVVSNDGKTMTIIIARNPNGLPGAVQVFDRQ